MEQNEYLSFAQGGRRLAECSSDMTGKLTIPDSVDNICFLAFEGWPDLTSIEIPSSLTDVDEGTFAYLNGLTEIIVDEGNPSFCAKDAFLYSKDMTELLRVPGDIEFYVIPSHVKKINGAFGGCDYLTSIEIPNNLTEIGSHAFYYCDSLESVMINEGVAIIGGWAFAGCKSLKTIEIPRSVTKIESFAFDGCESLTNIDIPEGVTKIGIYAFNNCSSLTSIKIPESMKEIGENAFSGCTGITTIRIPSGVSSINSGAFSGTGLTEIIVDEGNPHYCTRDGVLYSKDMTEILWAPKDLETFTIPEGVKSIQGAFTECDDLCWIMIPGSVKEIEEESFSCCSGLTTVVILPGVTRICYFAFNLCINLISIDIPESVTEIDEFAFFVDENITAIHLRHKKPVNFSKAFRYLDLPSITLYVPWGSKRLYQRHRFYRKFGRIVAEKKN